MPSTAHSKEWALLALLPGRPVSPSLLKSKLCLYVPFLPCTCQGHSDAKLNKQGTSDQLGSSPGAQPQGACG